MHTSLVEEGAGGVAVLSTGQVIRWWELRRLLYNVVLLVVGVAAIAGMEWLMTKVIPLGEDAVEPMILVLGVVVYGVMVNLCYTLDGSSSCGAESRIQCLRGDVENGCSGRVYCSLAC